MLFRAALQTLTAATMPFKAAFPEHNTDAFGLKLLNICSLPIAANYGDCAGIYSTLTFRGVALKLKGGGRIAGRICGQRVPRLRRGPGGGAIPEDAAHVSAWPGKVLRRCYAMSGTEIGHGSTVLDSRYAKSGTEYGHVTRRTGARQYCSFA
eukprot:782968-Rhodomonas_salina.3